MRWSARFAAFALLLQCCGSSCGDPNSGGVEPPPPAGPAVPHLRTAAGTLELRVRVSKPELTVDCGMTGYSVPVDDALFAPARSMSLGAQPVAVYRLEDRPPGSEQRCVLLALELPDGPVVLRTNPGYQNYAIEKDSSGHFSVTGANVLAVPKSANPACPSAKMLTSSETVLTGTALVQIVGLPDADGCQMLRLRPPASDGPTIGWSACMGDAKIPFAMGDTLRISQNENPTTHARVVRMERSEGERVVLWLLRGQPGELPAAGWDTKLASLAGTQRSDECRPMLRPGCRTLEIPDQLNVTVGQRAWNLKAGENASVIVPDGPKLEIHVVHSVFRPVVDAACAKDVSGSATDAGLVIIERGGASKTPPQIAAPGAG